MANFLIGQKKKALAKEDVDNLEINRTENNLAVRRRMCDKAADENPIMILYSYPTSLFFKLFPK